MTDYTNKETNKRSHEPEVDYNYELRDIAFSSAFRNNFETPITKRSDVILLLKTCQRLTSFNLENILSFSRSYSNMHATNNSSKRTEPTIFIEPNSSFDSPSVSKLKSLIEGDGGYKLGPEIPPSSLADISPALSLNDFIYALRNLNIESVGAIVPNSNRHGYTYTWLVFWKPKLFWSS